MLTPLDASELNKRDLCGGDTMFYEFAMLQFSSTYIHIDRVVLPATLPPFPTGIETNEQIAMVHIPVQYFSNIDTSSPSGVCVRDRVRRRAYFSSSRSWIFRYKQSFQLDNLMSNQMYRNFI